MNRQDHRNRQQGGSQEEAYSQPLRQQGGSSEGSRQRSQSDRPSGLDRDYQGAGYAGPGGYGGGYGGQNVGQGRDPNGGGARGNQQFDPDYDQWRREHVKALDDDYKQWREDRFKKFADEFSSWRSSRSQRSDTDHKADAGTTTSGRQDKESKS